MTDAGCVRARSAAYIPQPTSHIRHRAFTLVEATLSIAITSILLVGMGAALAMTMGAVETGDDSNAHAAQASEQLSKLNAELSTATAISSFSANDIAFTVPDRNNDGSPETIEYTWSGRAGDSMLRIYNGNKPVAWINSVQACSTAYIDRPAAVAVESAEQILAQCDAVAGATAKTRAVDSSNYLAQYVRPTLPAGAVSWKITRVSFFANKNSGNSNPLHASIYTASAALTPALPILASASFIGSSFGSTAAWHEVPLSPVSGLAPTQGVCIVLDGASGSGSINAAYLQGGSAQPFNTHLTLSTNSGSSWSSPDDTRDMRFILTGTYTTMVEP